LLLLLLFFFLVDLLLACLFVCLFVCLLFNAMSCIFVAPAFGVVVFVAC